MTDTEDILTYETLSDFQDSMYIEEDLIEGEALHDTILIEGGRYPIILTRVLGKGAYGTAYYGKRNDEEVVVKIFKSDVECQYDSEISLASTIDCGNLHLLCLKEFMKYKDKCIAVYQYVKGVQELFKIIQSSQLTTYATNTILLILYDLVDGLSYIHDHGFLHLDIKGENILIKDKKLGILIDYGISCKLDNTGTNPCNKAFKSGTSYYRAPEVVSMRHSLTPSSDVFSLGVVFAEVFENTTFDKKESEEQIRYSMIQKRFNFNNRIGFNDLIFRKLKPLILSMLDHVPENRPSLSEIKTQLIDLIYESSAL
jgi:serine/threonine protein kinase